MEKLIILLLLTCYGFTHSQTVQDKNYSTTVYIKNHGTLQDGSLSTYGYVKDDGTVQDKNHSTIGYAK